MARRARGFAPSQVVADEQIEPAVAVVVNPRRGHAPSAFARLVPRELRRDKATLCRHVSERAVAVVPPELVWTELGKKQIDAAVAVEVAHGHAHTAVMRHDAA